MTDVSRPRCDIPFEHAWAVTRASEVVATSGHGDRVFALASVTKLLSAWSVLVAVSRHLLTLDDATGIDGVSVRHLLSHASGLPFESREPQCSVEKRRIYSNSGYEILGDIINDATGRTMPEWIDESLLQPLGMAATDVPGSTAHSGVASMNDLVVFAQELRKPTLIAPELAREARSIQFPHLAGVVPGYGRFTPCPWGLGPEIKGEKTSHWMAPSASPSSFGHFGVAGSFLWVDPDSDMSAVFLGSEPFGPWHKEHWAQLNEWFLHLCDEGASRE